jgi:hypothetical protein
MERMGTRLNFKKTLVLAAIFFGVVGCADSTSFRTNDPSNAGHLKPSDSIFVAIADDGAFGDERYPGSGRDTSQIIFRALSKYAKTVRLGQSAQPFNQAIETARRSGQQYLAYPTIMHWEDRATEWDFMPDRVEVKIEVVSVVSGHQLSNVTVSGRSGIATLGGDKPQELLPKPLEKYAETLFSGPIESNPSVPQEATMSSAAANTVTQPPAASARWLFQAEKTAQVSFCGRPALVNSVAGIELYATSCNNSPATIRCEFGKCAVQ